MTVHFLNNYSMTWAMGLIEQGKYPRQHLYGIDPWDTRLPIRLAPFRSHSTLTRLSRQAHWVAGDLLQEQGVIRAARPGDVVYSAEPRAVEGLAHARQLRAFRHPVVAVMHHPFPVTRRSRHALAGLDRIVSLSTAVADHLERKLDVDPSRVRVLQWGADLGCPLYRSTADSHIVSSGKTGRDQSLLLRALEGLDLPAIVYARTPTGLRTAPTTELVTPETHVDRSGRLSEPKFTFEHVIADLAKAAIVVIPLLERDVLAGLSELVDAMALGKPVVMTRNPYIDLDIEALGFGVWVEPGDAAGMRRAISDLMGDDDKRRAMGARARAAAEASWNEAAFRSGVTSLLREMHDSGL